jgi:uncharacterized membrane protein
MPSISPRTQASSPATSHDRRLKYLLWFLMGSATISVIFYSEIPLLNRAQEQASLRAVLWLIVPHVIAGTFAFLSGPLQFSSRLRRRHTKFHRVLGRLYVGSVFIAAPLAVALAARDHHYKSIYFLIATSIQSTAWVIPTAAAILAARARRIQQHRVWMIRSYAVTFTFVLTRVVQPIPGWSRLGRIGLATGIVSITVLAFLTPEVASCLRRLTSLRILTQEHKPRP